MPIKNPENSLDDEVDAFSVSNVREQPIDPRTLPSAKRGLFFLSKPKPDQKSVILISHANQTDTVAGDYFGATLYTYTRPSGKKYKYQHLLKDIIDEYPAKKMRISEEDELVIIDKTFTPHLNHKQVLNSFHHDVKVDGKTRFCLVLRRDKKQSSREWYETSAILHPDHRSQHNDAAPIAKQLKWLNLGLNPQPIRFPPQQIHFSIYDCSLYMFIDQCGIHGVPIERDDDSIYVNKIVEVSFNKLSCKAALYGMDGTSYVQIDDQRKIRISGESICTWFGCEKKGSDNKFFVDDCFLSYDKIEKKFVMSKIKEGRTCVIFVDEGDHPDCATDDIDSGYASKVGSQENDTWTPDDTICLSTDNLDMD
ncbi:uncharacterized protein LOC127834969 [Dreissena polymorpha]|uniref:Uncharacterized protein n=1 Tax=Dreissena polymorpha TaxID=45954 RepID=A0A9D4FZ02_DREPO|nr:uncharacterized protein LOC127834969 [Dreissena polymorpha]XP_052217091.1 uncharacterized protein LOC127834969 [Dreissena polymorpha]XP_052217092.1 uncharacterized protein LOC127834969 [Dreissena polymorpha]KAH3807729.1 hypothetical protein DPMN_136076 [Dreissena polymorpha]